MASFHAVNQYIQASTGAAGFQPAATPSSAVTAPSPLQPRLDAVSDASLILYRAAEAAEGLSGRALRKLPFQAHAFFVQVHNSLAMPCVCRSPSVSVRARACACVRYFIFLSTLVARQLATVVRVYSCGLRPGGTVWT
jgi:hypothetical protein